MGLWQTVRGRRKRSLAAVVAATTATVVLAVVLVLVLRSAPSGPLKTETTAQSFGSPQDAGTAFTFAHLLVVNEGVEPAVLSELIPIDANPEIKVVGLLAGRPSSDQILRATFPTFPPEVDERGYEYELPALEPLEGYVVPPASQADQTQLYVGLRSSKSDGVARIDSFRLHYTVGEAEYELEFPYAVGICAPRFTQECFIPLPG